jgi:hypothetical protein
VRNNGSPVTTQAPESPQATLNLVGRLVSDVDAQQKWLAQCPPALASLFNEAFLLVGGLVSETGYDVEEVLDALGCEKRSETELRRMSVAELTSCRDFFAWATELSHAAPADTRVKQAVIEGCGGIYRLAKTDLATVKRAFETPLAPGDLLTPDKLIIIGEAGSAFQWAQASLRRDGDSHWPAVGPVVHIRRGNLDEYLRWVDDRERAAMSLERVARISDHLQDCEACADAMGRRANVLGISVGDALRFDPIQPTVP